MFDLDTKNSLVDLLKSLGRNSEFPSRLVLYRHMMNDKNANYSGTADQNRKLIAYIENAIQNKLHDYLFHYNMYTKEWNAVLRGDYADLFSNLGKATVLKDKDFQQLCRRIKAQNPISFN